MNVIMEKEQLFKIEDIARYLGYKSAKMESETLEVIEEIRELFWNLNSWKVDYQVFLVKRTGEEVGLLNTPFFFQGKQIKEMLTDCEECILMAVTLGSSIDMQLRKLQIIDMSKALIADACASSMVECICDQLEEVLKKDYLEKGLYFTDRFSPGYGDFPLDTQKNFCAVLHTTKKVGIHVSSSGIMNPSKSITAVIGIAKEPQKMKIKGCAYCNLLANCNYRKGGKTCNGTIISE